MIEKIKRIANLLTSIDVIKTIYLNFKVFPIHIARLFPIYIGRNVDIHEVHRGSIAFKDGIAIKKGMVCIGICRTPMVSNHELYTILRISPNAKLILGDSVKIYSGCSIIVTYNGIAHIGNDFLMNQKSRLYCASSLNIGDHCRVGWETQIYDSNFHFTYDSTNHCIGNAMGNVSIGNNVWIGNRCTISKGSMLPDYAIIGSNSLVSKKLSNNFGGGIWVGMPVSLKKEGFYRILDNQVQSNLFSYFANEGAKEKLKEIFLSDEELERCLNHE